MKKLAVNKVATMSASETVYVSRTVIFDRLIEFNKQKENDLEVERILLNAVKKIYIREKKAKVPARVFGARMKIKDIRKAFGNIKNMPNNAFRVAKRN